MTDRVLTPREVEVYRSLAFHNSDIASVITLCASHERLRAERDLLRAALRDCDGEAYNGQLDGHDALASLREIQNTARKSLEER